MEQINGETLFWLFSLGIFVGLFTQVTMGDKGVGLIPNLVGGAVGSVIMGMGAILLALPGTLLFGLLGCLSILFLTNVFSVDQEHDSGVKIRQNPSS